MVIVQLNKCNLCSCGAKTVTVGDDNGGWRVEGVVGSTSLVRTAEVGDDLWKRGRAGLEALIARERIDYRLESQRRFLALMDEAEAEASEAGNGEEE